MQLLLYISNGVQLDVKVIRFKDAALFKLPFVWILDNLR